MRTILFYALIFGALSAALFSCTKAKADKSEQKVQVTPVAHPIEEVVATPTQVVDTIFGGVLQFDPNCKSETCPGISFEYHGNTLVFAPVFHDQIDSSIMEEIMFVLEDDTVSTETTESGAIAFTLLSRGEQIKDQVERISSNTGWEIRDPYSRN